MTDLRFVCKARLQCREDLVPSLRRAGEQSRIWLTVHDDHRLDQVIKQLMKLEDVHGVRRAAAGDEVFGRIAAVLL